MNEVWNVALELAKRDGWRNVTRRPLIAALQQAGVIPGDRDQNQCENWCRNYLRGNNSLSRLRARLSKEPGIGEGKRRGERSPAWSDVNRDQVFEAAYKLVIDQGKLMVPRSEIAEAAGVSNGYVSILWDGMPNLRKAIVERARVEGHERIVLQAEALT